jgi:hypothetical protein
MDLHFSTIRDFLLLSRGQFASLLVDSALPDVLAARATDVYLHTVRSILDHSVKGSLPKRGVIVEEILYGKLDVELLEVGDSSPLLTSMVFLVFLSVFPTS